MTITGEKNALPGIYVEDRALFQMKGSMQTNPGLKAVLQEIMKRDVPVVIYTYDSLHVHEANMVTLVPGLRAPSVHFSELSAARLETVVATTSDLRQGATPFTGNRQLAADNTEGHLIVSEDYYRRHLGHYLMPQRSPRPNTSGLH